MADICKIVAVKRSNIYDIPEYRKECRDIVIAAWHKGLYYNDGGILRYVDPKAMDTVVLGQGTDYCSQFVDHNYLLNSGGKFNVGSGCDDHVSPRAIQICSKLSDVPCVKGHFDFHEMDTILTTSSSALAEAIRLRTAGVEHTFDLTVATHAGIIVNVEGRWAVVEMLDYIELSSINKYLN